MRLQTRRETPALLTGLIFTESGRAMTPTHTRKGSRLYRYYISTDLVRGREKAAAESLARLPAELSETATVREVLRLIRSPEIVAQTIKAVRAEAPDTSDGEIVAILDQFWALWATLIPAEQARVIRLLVERVVVRPDGVAITLHAAGLGQIAHEMLSLDGARRAA